MTMTRQERSKQRKSMNRALLNVAFSESHRHAEVLAVQIPRISYQFMDEEQMRSAVRQMMVVRMTYMTYPQRITIDAERAQEMFEWQQTREVKAIGEPSA